MIEPLREVWTSSRHVVITLPRTMCAYCRCDTPSPWLPYCSDQHRDLHALILAEWHAPERR